MEMDVLAGVRYFCVHICARADDQARNQLGTPRGAKSFLRGAQIFYTMSIGLNYVQNIFPPGAKNFLGGSAPPGYGPADDAYRTQ